MNTAIENKNISLYNFFPEKNKNKRNLKKLTPRLEKERRYFLKKIYDKTFDINELIESYLEWVNYDEYIILKRYAIYDIKYFAIKCSKRGNDVYRYRVNKKFDLIFEALEKDSKDYDNCYVLKSNILFVTLTYALREIKNYDNVRDHINIFMKNLRRIFKSAKIICRNFEAQKDGTVHIHALIYIGVNIDITQHINENNEITFRIANYQLLQKIKNCWKYGFSDIQAFIKVREGLTYIFKYITKNVNVKNKNAILTLSLNWLFRKRSFYINYQLLSSQFNLRLDILKHSDDKEKTNNNNNDEKIKNEKKKKNNLKQITIEGNGIKNKVIWVFLGIYSKEFLEIKTKKWKVEIKRKIVLKILEEKEKRSKKIF